jgi:PAS domain S-box-containing protein
VVRNDRNAVAAPNQHTDADARFATALRGDYVPLYERTFIGKNGKRVEVEINLSPVRDQTGKIILVQSVARDISDRKKAREALQRSEASYRALFENANDAIFLINPNGTIQSVNARCVDLLGYAAEEMIGMNSLDFIVPTENDDAYLRMGKLLAGERIPVYERRFIRKDGEQIETEINLSLVFEENGQPKLMQSVVRDITERKKAQEALRISRDKLSAANAALEKASRLKDEFLASMSHELRTPLTGILGLSEAMQLQTFGALNEKQLRAVRNIESSGRHLLELINDILDLSKIEAGKLDMQFEPCSVGDICQASLQLVKGMAHQKRINISFSMGTASVNVRADSRRLKQMLVNLFSNAIKFTPEEGKVGLDVVASDQKKAVFLSVWDKGIGIKPEDMEKLFKPFTQLDSSLARQYSGTGLGLSLVQRMAELHGGSIKVESVPGEGSRFTIILPWSSGVTQPIPGIKLKGTGPLKNTLVIEDNNLDAEHITRYLKELGIPSIIYPILKGALQKAETLHPSVILLDLNMPDGFGLELLTQLKGNEQTRGIPVIITSVEERRAEAMKLGAVGYLLKPFGQQDLQMELAKAAAFSDLSDPVMVIGARTASPLVMVADDNEMIIEMLSDFLISRKCRVYAVRSGFELIERAPELHPDIILVDIQMPGLDGMETMRRIRAHSDPQVAGTPIIAVTALAMSGDREKCLQAGANEYMSKPVVLAQLIEKIQHLINRNAQ